MTPLEALADYLVDISDFCGIIPCDTISDPTWCENNCQNVRKECWIKYAENKAQGRQNERN